MDPTIVQIIDYKKDISNSFRNEFLKYHHIANTIERDHLIIPIVLALNNEKYIPFPNKVDYRLRRLLELTLVFINHRASAARLLELNFIREKIDELYKNNIIKDDELYQKISSFPIRDDNYKFSFEKKIFKKKSKTKEFNNNNNNGEIINKTPIFQQSSLKDKIHSKSLTLIPEHKSRTSVKIPKVSKKSLFNSPKIKEYDYSRLFCALIYFIFTSPKKIISNGFFGENEINRRVLFS